MGWLRAQGFRTVAMALRDDSVPLNDPRLLAEERTDLTIRVYDSVSGSLGTGMMVLQLAEDIRLGMDWNTLTERRVPWLIRNTFPFFSVDTLEYLQKGGRIGKAAALIGNMISLTPVLTVNDGEASTFSKCRTQKKALAKMLQVLGEDTAPSGLKNLVVHYIGSKAPAVKWAEEKVAPLIGFMPRVVPASPVIGVHVGPAIGIAYECNAPIPNKFHGSEPEIIVC